MMNSTFNLDTPPEFRGLHPDLPVHRYQRLLPHWRQAGATYFVTFRQNDALPQEKLKFLKRIRSEWQLHCAQMKREVDWEAYAKVYTSKAEHWLDEGSGTCHFHEKRWTDELRNRLLHFQDERYFLSCYCIMPNHCHLLICPLGQHKLEDLVGAMKGVFARSINRELKLTATFWSEESYDRIVRDGEHLWSVVQYIGRNPLKAKLASELSWRRWVHPEWEALGWKFFDS